MHYAGSVICMRKGRAPVSSDTPKRLRSQDWFDNSGNPDMTAIYVERYLNSD